MKKRLAKWFLLVAKRLDPSTQLVNAQVIEDYEAQKIGLTYVVTKKDIKDYRFKDGARMSMREGRRFLIRDIRRKLRLHIIGCIDANRLIEYNMDEQEDGLHISAELKVYVPSRQDGEIQAT